MFTQIKSELELQGYKMIRIDLNKFKEDMLHAYIETYLLETRSVTEVCNPMLSAVINIPDDILKETIKLYVERVDADITPKEFMEYIIEIQKGHLLFIDDVRTVEKTVSHPGIFAYAKNRNEAINFIVKCDTEPLILRHVFFDYYLGDFTSEVVAEYLQYGDTKQENLTWSCHSSDPGNKDFLADIMTDLKHGEYIPSWETFKV